jgi:hypothetical protein
VMELGYSIQLVWPLASGEAVESGYEKIEPEHLFNALLKFVELGGRDLQPLLKDQATLSKMLEEQEAVIKVLHDRGLSIPKDTTALRRRLRGLMGRGDARPDGKKMVHRSDASRVLCKRAEALASAAGASSWQGAHLAAALLEKPQGRLAEALKTANVEPPKPVETKLLDRYGSSLNPGSAAPTGQETADPAVKVVLENLQSAAGCGLLLIEKGGRPALELIREVAALPAPEGKQRRFVRIDLTRLECSGAKGSGLLAGLLEEAARVEAVLYLEGLPELLEKGEGHPDPAALEQALADKQVCCVLTADEAAYQERLTKQPWRRLLKPVWLHSLPKLPW